MYKKKYHHFNFDATSPGKVNVHCAHDGPVTTLNILKVDAELKLLMMTYQQWCHQKQWRSWVGVDARAHSNVGGASGQVN